MEIPIFLFRFLPWKHLKPVYFRVHTYAFTVEEGELATILPGVTTSFGQEFSRKALKCHERQNISEMLFTT